MRSLQVPVEAISAPISYLTKAFIHYADVIDFVFMPLNFSGIYSYVPLHNFFIINGSSK